MSSPRRRDRSPKGKISKLSGRVSLPANIIPLFTPVVRLEKPTNDTQDARLLSLDLYQTAYPDDSTQGGPCANLLCDFCEEQHKFRLQELENSEL